MFKDASQRKGVDWPEVIWDRWISFEYQFGSLEDIGKTTNAVKEFKRKEDERRTKMWQAHAAAYSAAGPTSATTTLAIDQPPTKSDQLQVVSQNGLTDDGMDIDVNEVVVPAAPERQLKRKRSENEEIVGSPSPKKAKHDEAALVQAPSPLPIAATTSTEAANLKRDRERTTVLVSNLPEATTQDEVQKLFKDCGEIREIVLQKLPNELVATVEFMDRESIPAALTKDKKRILGAEIVVNIGWQSTLFVTNFQEGMDDVKMRALFEKVDVLARKLGCDHADNF